MADDARTQITQLLAAAGSGDASGAAAAAERLLPLVYDELRRLAGARMRGQAAGHTLQATALVHEAYLRLVGDAPIAWRGRGHFFAAAARAMRHILVDRARRQARVRHGGGRERESLGVDLDAVAAPDAPAPAELLALDEALQRLEQIDARRSQVVSLRYFAGLTIDETAAALGIAAATVERDWQFAKAWLHRALHGTDAGDAERARQGERPVSEP